jgi:predicted RND superfamily exporter protein
MKKLSPRNEEIILIVTALFVLVSSMLNATASIVIAVISLAVFLGYNNLTAEKKNDLRDGEPK